MKESGDGKYSYDSTVKLSTQVRVSNTRNPQKHQSSVLELPKFENHSEREKNDEGMKLIHYIHSEQLYLNDGNCHT